MISRIPITVVARNEEKAIGACLRSLLASARAAEAAVPFRFDFLAVLDDCTDGTAAEVARFPEVRQVTSSGGKVQAQRRGAREGPFQIYSDADIQVDEQAIGGLCEALLRNPRALVASPPRIPLPPRLRTPLAWSLHLYNLRRGFSSQRTWFNGKLFAVRGLSWPSREELRRRACGLRESRFHDYAADLRVDDIWLSRQALLLGGPESLVESTRGSIRYRAPETLRGMYRYYRRLRRELDRTDALFPESMEVQRRFGARRADLLASAPWGERAAALLFDAALLACRLERTAVDRTPGPPLDAWPAIDETKLP